MHDPFDLERFLIAQNCGGIYDQALAELHLGRKTSHWMWFVFPQMAGLGTSRMSQHYALSSLDEARSYLQHAVLGPRLREVATIVSVTHGSSARKIFGRIDAQKLQSSMTLFARAVPTEPVFPAVLEQFFDGASDPMTDGLVGFI